MSIPFFHLTKSYLFFERIKKEIVYYPPEITKVKMFGRYVNIPRLQIAYGDPGLKYIFSGTQIPAKNWNSLIYEIKTEIEKKYSYNYNFCLINSYKNGNHSIGQHRDDEKQLDLSAPIIGVSFGQERALILKKNNKNLKIILGHESLFSLNYPTNRFWTHGIPKDRLIHNPRVCLTFRKLIPHSTR